MSDGLNKKQQLFLLCLDNAEEVILNDNEEFASALAQLYDECPNLHVIVTSIRDIGRLPNEIDPKPCIVRQLRSQSAVELFLENTGYIENGDFIQFLQTDVNYPFKKLCPSLKDKENFSVSDLTPEIIKEIRIRLMSHKNLIEALAAHDMFRQLSGNPTSITMIAAIIKNPMIKKAEKNTLIDMYNRIKSEKDIVVEDLAEEGEDFNMKAIPRVYKNTMSLKISTEMGVKLLETTYPDDMYLLFFLGCLPGGVKFYQLK